MDPAAAARAHAIAVSWSLRHACASNAQLAVFANVCRGWRAVAARAVADAARADGEHRPPLAASAGNGEGGGATPADEEMAGGTVAAVPRSSSLRRLLLTDMARELVARRMHDDHGRADATKTRDDAAGECCLAWFAPSGIRTASVVLDDEEEDEGPAEDGAWLGRRHGRRRARQRTVTCCPEWRGYREAAEVLVPFGYAEAFVAVSVTAGRGAGGGSGGGCARAALRGRGCSDEGGGSGRGRGAGAGEGGQTPLAGGSRRVRGGRGRGHGRGRGPEDTSKVDEGVAEDTCQGRGSRNAHAAFCARRRARH